MKIIVSKIDVAVSQLCEAINLFFENRDPISIHTLTWAALDIFHAHMPLVNGYVTKKFAFSHYNNINVKDEFRKDFANLVRKNRNFFKHADKDLKNNIVEIEFETEINNFLIQEAIYCLMSIQANDYKFLPEFRCFNAWYFAKYPTYIKDEYKEEYSDLKDLDPSDLPLFKEVLKTLKDDPELLNNKTDKRNYA